jgi:hypothetical protein
MLVTCDLVLDCRAIVRVTLVPLTVDDRLPCQRRNTRRKKKRICADIDLADAISLGFNSLIWRAGKPTAYSRGVEQVWEPTPLPWI